MSAITDNVFGRRRAPGALRAPKPSGGVVRAIGRVLLGIVIGVVIFVGFSAVMRMQSVALPAVSGESAVGRTEIALVDSDRIDPFAADGRTRELAVWIWYPTAGGASGTAAPHLPAAWAPLVNNEGPFRQDLEAVVTNSIANAALDGHPPVVVLLPGLGQPVASYSALAEDLASHGYAVVGINPSESADVVFPDGHVVAATSLGTVAETTVDAWYPSADRVATVWVEDAQFVVETLRAQAPEIGALDLDRVAYIGHSMGGAAAFEACRQDARCAGTVDLDGTLWTEVREAGLTAPALLIEKAAVDGCDAFCERAAVDFATVMAAPTATRLSVAGTTHMDFTDLGLMWGVTNGIALGSIEPERMTVLVRDTVRSFLDVHVLGAPAAGFAETVSTYSELSSSE
jgi:predicted dienelactone hydrolase